MWHERQGGLRCSGCGCGYGSLTGECEEEEGGGKVEFQGDHPAAAGGGAGGSREQGQTWSQSGVQRLCGGAQADPPTPRYLALSMPARCIWL